MKKIKFNIYNIEELKEVASPQTYNSVVEKAKIEEKEFIKELEYQDFSDFLNSKEFKYILDMFNITYSQYNHYSDYLFRIQGANYSEDVHGVRAYGKLHLFIKELEKINNVCCWAEELFIKSLKNSINNSLKYGFFETVEDALNNILYAIERIDISDNEIIDILMANNIHYTIDGQQW